MVRFVDRDMVMRYYWGLGVGHIYSHTSASPSISVNPHVAEEEPHAEEMESVPLTLNAAGSYLLEMDSDAEEHDNEEDPELGLGNRQDEIWVDDADSDAESDADDHHDSDSDSIFLEHNMCFD